MRILLSKFQIFIFNSLFEIVDVIDRTLQLSKRENIDMNDIFIRESTKKMNEKTLKHNDTIKNGMEIKINEKKEIIERVRNLIPKNKILIQNKNYALYTMDAYQNEFKRIDEIVKVISGCLPNSQKEDILRKLHLTSFNLPQTFYELKYPQSKKYIFTETEDYIIRNMQGSDIYNELIKVKGEKNVLQRKRYLNY